MNWPYGHDRSVSLGRPVLVGILNVTPDSFSDGGLYSTADDAAAHADRMVEEGADIVDVGGESTRPGAERISAEKQLERVLPVIRAVRDRVAVPISVDTTQGRVASEAVEAGATIVNDVTAGRDDPELLTVVAARDAGLVLMHMQGEPATMQASPTYRDVVGEVRAFLLDRARLASAAGVDPRRIAVDPGIGFGKTTEHNLVLLRRLPAFVETGYPLLVGASRKRFVGEITEAATMADRAAGTAAITALGVAAGARLFRVHDVRPNRQAADMAAAIYNR